MGFIRMKRNYDTGKNSFLDPINFGGAFIFAGLIAAGFGLYQAWQGTGNGLIWIAVGLIVNQAGMCIIDVQNRMKKMISDIEDTERGDRLQTQIQEIYNQMELTEERRKNETEKDTQNIWREIHDIRDMVLDISDRLPKK